MSQAHRVKTIGKCGICGKCVELEMIRGYDFGMCALIVPIQKDENTRDIVLSLAPLIDFISKSITNRLQDCIA